MKPLLPAAVALAFAVSGAALAQPAAADQQPPAQQQATAPMSANERAGLPDLNAINRPAAEVSSKVDINVPRTPSFHETSGNGTEITEYRDRGKPVEIDVRSNFGTRYQMTAPTDTSPQVHDSARPTTRLPSVHLNY
jgi:hypothetical protein